MTDPAYTATAARVEAALAAAPDAEAAMTAAVTVLAREVPSYTWVGIYLLAGNELVLGPFVGAPSPHTRIPLGRGICGAAASERITIVVDDVNSDPRYLACSLETKSEIVVPILAGDQVLGEIDIDSDRPAAFGQADRLLLERVARALARRLDPSAS
jgi:GAF domain-containing protein